MNDFKYLTPEDYRKLKPFFLDFPYSLSIYSLPSLIAWNNENSATSYALQGDLLLIANLAGDKGKYPPYLILPLTSRRAPPPAELHAIAGAHGFSEYRYIPEDYLSRWQTDEIESHFSVFEQPEATDYIYVTSEIASLQGRRFAKKRNHISQFTRNYVLPGQVQTEAISPAIKDECLAFMEKWCDEYPCDGPDRESLMCEQNAISLSLDNFELLELCGQVVRVKGEICAFGVTASLNKKMGILHFEKAFAGINGLYQFLDRHCAQTCLREFEFCNKESDMGLSGLAQSKQSYFPCCRVKSYRLVRRTSITGENVRTEA